GQPENSSSGFQLFDALTDLIAAAVATKVSKAGDTMSGNLAMGGSKVTGLGQPLANGEAARYQEIQTLSSVLADEISDRTDADADLQTQINNLLPTGSIIMWSGTSAPTGWALCDGGGGRPDLRGKFIVGYHPSDPDYDAIGD